MPQRRSGPRWIESRTELCALASPVRQEIVDVLVSAGRSSIADLAAYLGRPADALYFHVRRLLRAGLLVELEPRKRGRHVAGVYDVAGRPLEIRYGAATVGEVSRVLRAAVRLGTRDMDRALGTVAALKNERTRQFRAGRVKGWVDRKQLRRINALMLELIEILREGTPGSRRRLQSFTFVLAPITPSRRRAPKRKGAVV